eukprot:CAMPEP_0113308740 /NCGR_PEP_ID=MMETSP0010_2-20120614/7068_1 /TAXON_ID=216773 ORGANISM="Corethron hystrix, Strain 308" /NCGR_SAMPLE_ID=MMETSP0010_2 /ASSEMBLY_ACC=CAM_ASM_000155 /LENGTH=206 /DNA_ID=CAMNT_0000163863 /DNA_START=113 /DNA_END=730 /DNA_ORIENTATION=- /assembly_acc=CAM_ASM_000155
MYSLDVDPSSARGEEDAPGCRREPLRFQFTGLSVWLSIDDDDDFSRAIDYMSSSHGIFRIPENHVTAIYGMDLEENLARQKFDIVRKEFGRWEDTLRPVGVIVDVEIAGRNGGLMDMAWSEITYSSSTTHERMLDRLHEIFYDGTCVRQGPWKPHCSLAYDNPEDPALTLHATVDFIAKETPSLLTKTRTVTGMSLWRTEGTMEEW